MDISVVVPFYNVDEYIEDCVKALLTQTYPKDCYEIIMIDNNSTDRSAEIVRRYPQVRLLFEPRPGAYVARNRGLAESRGAIIAFTDSDCFPSPEWLRNISKAMLCPQTGIVMGRRRFASESLGLSILSDYESEKAAYIFSGTTKEAAYGYTNNMAVRRCLFNRIGPFLELKRGADTIFVHRAIEKYSCDIVQYSSNVCVRHLEITSIWKHFRKQCIYGWSFPSYHREVSRRSLTMTERLQVFRKTLRCGRYSLAKSVFSFLLVSIGLFCSKLGRSSAVFYRLCNFFRSWS
jgi:glycosyltransferase involved in cell wall biosynthesis